MFYTVLKKANLRALKWTEKEDKEMEGIPIH